MQEILPVLEIKNLYLLMQKLDAAASDNTLLSHH